MRPATRSTWIFLMGMVAATSCGSADTILEVRVGSAGLVPGITQMDVRLTIGDRTRDFLVPEIERPIALPTNFSVQIEPGLNGVVRVYVLARAGTRVLSQASSELPRLRTGEVNLLTVNLPPLLMPIEDGGAGDGGVPGTLDGMMMDDGGMMIMDDGGRPMMDDGMPMMDGGRPMMDDGMPMMDGGRPMMDGGMPMMDGGRPVMDAALDGPAPVPDTATPEPDAEPDPDAGLEPDAEDDDADDAV